MSAISGTHWLLMSVGSSFYLNMLMEGRPRPPQNLRVRHLHHESPHNNHNPSSGNADAPITDNEGSDHDDSPPAENEGMNAHSPSKAKSMENHPQTREVWFAGTHSDM